MKLLKKSEIDSMKAAETQRAVQEGIKLARRVDGLRETVAEEEASLEKFRRETLARINEEITKTAGERDIIKAEVSRLQGEREEALKPLHEELRLIQEGKDQLVQDREALELRERELGLLEGTARRDADMARDELARAEEKSRRYHALLSDAEELYREEKVACRSAERSLVEAQALRAQAERELARVNETAAANERRHAARDKEQDSREKRLNVRETMLKDREETIERTISRLNK